MNIMKQEFSLVYLTVPDCAPPEMIELAARAGYDAVSLRTIAMGLPNEPDFGLARNKDLYRQTKTALAATGLKINDIENARIYDGIDIKRYLPEMEIAAELGVKHILTNIWTSDRNFVIEKFAELCELAQTVGMSVNIEFVTWASVTNMKEALGIIRDAKSENAGIVLDTLHFHRSRCLLEDLATVPPEFFRFVHLCDAPSEIPTTVDELIHTGREERLYLGEGGIDIAAIVGRLPEVVYGIEVPNRKLAKEIGNEEHVKRSLETAKNYLNLRIGVQNQ